MRLEYNVPGQQQNNPNLKFHALELYAIVYTIGQELYQAVRRNDNCSYALGNDDLQRGPNTDRINITIQHPADWLQVIARINHSTLAKRIGKCNIKIGNDGANTTVSPSYVSFPVLLDGAENDGSYASITHEVKKYRNLWQQKNDPNFSGSVKKRSAGIVWTSALENQDNEKCRNFVDALLILTMGVEGSRCPEMAFFFRLLLDLIDMNRSYGKHNKPFCWDNLFISGHEYFWDNPSLKDSTEKLNYGGKYPGSVTSTGTGNFSTFSNYMESLYKKLFPTNPADFNQGNIDRAIAETQALIVDEPQKFAHARRGCSLIVHWLESLEDQHNDNISSIFNNINDRQSALKKMRQLIVSRYFAYFGLKKSIGNNVTHGDVHRKIRNLLLGKFAITKEDLFGFKISPKHERDFPAHLKQSPHASRYFQVVYNLAINNIISNSMLGWYWHTNVNCKLLSEHVFSQPRPTTINNDDIEQQGTTIVKGFLDVPQTTNQIITSAWKRTCPFCFKQPNSTAAVVQPYEGKMTVKI